MAEEFKIALGIELNTGELDAIKSQIDGIKPTPIKLTLDASNVTSQLNTIRNQIQSLSRIRINLGGNGSGGNSSAVNAVTKSYRELLSMAKQISNLEIKIGGLKTAGGNTNQIAVLEGQLKSLQGTYEQLMNTFARSESLNSGGLDIGDLANLQAAVDQSKEKLSELDAKVADTKAKLAEGINAKFDNGIFSNELSKMESGFDKLRSKSTETVTAMEQFKTAFSNLNIAKQSGDVDKIVSSYETYKTALQNVKNQIDINTRAEQEMMNVEKLSNAKTAFSSQIDVWLKNNSAAAKQFGSQIAQIKAQIQSADGVALNNLKAQFQEVTRQAELAGKAGQNFGDKLKAQLGKLGTYFSATMLITQGIQAMRSMYDNVVKVDTAMTELYRVTDLSSSQYTTLYDNMVSSAKTYGAELDSLINSTASWVRLGFNTDDANRLAEITAMYQHVTDLDESTAVENLVTAYKGYQEQLLNLTGNDVTAAVEMVADIFDKLGNELPVTAAQVGEGLTKCASVMESAGATIQEASGMIVGGGSVTQDFDAMGNALKISTLRIHGMKGELQALNEDVDDNIDSVSKMQTQILNLTHGKVNIFEEDGETFRNIYDIFNDIATILPELSDKDAANLLETIAGKNRANQIQSMLKNWEEVKKAVNAANNAEGTAAKENEIYMDSLEGRLETLSATWQSFSNDFMSSDFLKGTISGLTGIVDILDKMINTFGTLGTIAIGNSIFQLFKNGGYFRTLSSSLMESTASFSNFGAAVKMAGTDLLSFMKTPAGIATGIGLITTAIGFGIQAYKNYKQAQQETWNSQIENGKAAREEVENISNLYLAYENAKSAYKSNAGSKDSLINATSDLLTALGYEKEAVNELMQNYEELDNKINLNQVTIDGLIQKLDTLQEGYTGAKNALLDITKDGNFIWEDNFFDSFSLMDWMEDTQEFGLKMGKILEDAGLISRSNYNQGGALSLGDTNTIEGVTEAYEKLISMRQALNDAVQDGRLTPDELTGSSLYQSIISKLNEFEKQYQEYEQFVNDMNTTQAKINVFDALNTSGIPKTKEEFDSLRQSIIDVSETGGAFVGTQEQIVGAIDDVLGSTPSLTQFVSGYGDSLKEMSNITDEQLEEVKSKFANNIISDWFENLSDEDKKLVYEIGVKSDDTTLYTLTRWKTELESMKETGKTTGEQMQSFYDIINNTEAGNFSDYVDSYTKKISTLQDALSKLDLGEMSQADKIDMAMTFPELAPYINDTDALKNAIQDLINTSNQDMNSMIDEMIAELAETAPEAAAALEAVKEALNGLISTDGGFNFDIDAEIERFNKLYDAMKESVSGTGLSTEGIANVKAMFQDLEGYDPSVLFERTEHGIHLNTTALRALQSQYESTKKLDIQTELQNLKQEYNDSAKAVEGLSDAEAKRVLQQKGLRNTDAILEDIQNVQTLAAQYEGLTSAYNKWIMAQSAGEEGDMYDNVTGSLKDIKQLYDDGLVGTNAFRSAVQMMTNEDLSTANIDKLISVYESGYPAMKRYFTEGQEGAITFLEDIQNINSEWAHMNQDGSWDIDFGIGNDEEIANAISEMTGLQVSTEEVQMIMRKLSDYGFDIKLDSAYSSIDELKSRIEETEGKLKELGQEPVDINIYAEGEEAQTELDKAKQKIEEIKNSDASIEVKTAQLEDAYAKVDVLVAKVNQPAFMSIDVSQVDSELQGALTTLQEYQTAVNNLNALEIKGADTSEIEAAKGKVDELAGKIQELPDDVKTKIGLETDGSIEDIKSQIYNDEVKITVTADTTQATTDISNIEGEEVEVKVETSGNEALDNLKSALEELEDKNIKVTADVEGLEDVKTLSDSVKNLESKEATATVKSVGKDDAVALSDAVEKIINKNATATVTSVGKDDAIALSQAVENITDKTVTATANTIGKDDVDALKASIDSLYDRTVTSTAKVIGTNLVIALKSAIDSLYSKTVSAGANVFGTSAVWALKSAIDSLYSKTVTATTVTRQVAGVDGTAHAQGTAFVKGDWGTKESGVALGGELGQELVVRDGHFFTIGDDAAEFFKYKKGDIIFNAEQTKQIFEKGKITHGVKRGKALVEGTAFSSGSGRFTQSGNTVTSSSAARRNNSSSSRSSGGSSNSSSSSSSEKEFEETFDWIEIKIARIERAIESLNKKASSTYRSWSDRNKNLVKEISKVESEMKIQQSGYDRYMKQAKAVGLDEKWAKKVRNGTIDISTIKDEDLADKIKKYQEWYEKALACQDAIEDLKETEAELYKTAFDNVAKQYENILSSIGHEQSMLEEYISQSEEKGYITSTKYYEALMKNERSQISKLQKEKTALITKMNEAVNSGAITQGSEAWYEMANQIDEVTLAIEQGNTALIEYSNAIRDIKWQIFDLIEERISNVTTEAQFLIDLLSSKDLFTDKGQLTNEGKSAMGLHAVNYNVYMSQADDYAKEMENVNKELAKDPANLELAERRQELLELQQEMILAAEDEKEAIVDMVKEGIELELDALKDLIDKYEDAIDAQKDLYDYENKIKDKTAEIASLQKQIQAYSGDTSEETKATVQKLKVSLEDAQKDLESTQYDKYISDQKKLLDELYNDYEMTLNMRLDNIDGLISDMIKAVNDSSGTIANTIYSTAASVGYTLSESMDNIWKEALAGSQADGQQRVSQTTSILSQLVANGKISSAEAENILAALGSGDAAQAQQALEQIQQLVANGNISKETANQIIAALSLGNQQQTLNALNTINKLTETGQLSTNDANNIIQALVTGDAGAIQNAQNIINRLVANGALSQEDAQNIIKALNDSASTNKDIVTIYGSNFSSKLTTTNEALASIKSLVQSILQKMDSQAATQVEEAHTSSVVTTTTQKPTTTTKKPTTTTKKPTTTTKKPTTTTKKGKTTKQKYGVALAIIEGNYGWGTGSTRVSRLKAKGFDANEIQNLVNKLVAEGYVNSGAWVGRYQGIKDLSPYHYNKFAMGVYKLDKDQLAWTQEKGTEYIMRPDGSLLTPLTRGTNVFNADASENLWDIANYPSEFIKDALGLNSNGFTTPVIQNTNGDTFTGDMNVSISLPNVSNYEQFKYQMQHDKSFEKMIKAMTVDRLFGGSSLKKYKC